jgi:hypothetical protein
MVVSTDKYWFAQLDEEAAQRRDQRSFHWFAEGGRSDVRGQVVNLEDGGELKLPHDRWPHHLFIVVGVHGSVDAQLEDRAFVLRAQSRLVVLPGTPCTLRARSAASIELVSMLSPPPSEAQFLNVDLEVRGPADLQPLIDDLGEDVVNLHAGRVHDHYLATFEATVSGDADHRISYLCRLVDQLDPEARRIWDQASSKVFDIGYEAGAGPKSYESNLRPETIADVARVGAAIRVTVYPPSKSPRRAG